MIKTKEEEEEEEDEDEEDEDEDEEDDDDYYYCYFYTSCCWCCVDGDKTRHLEPSHNFRSLGALRLSPKIIHASPTAHDISQHSSRHESHPRALPKP